MIKLFSDIIGHDDLKKYMKFAIQQDKIAHTYIFNGDSGTGKTVLTDLFVRAMLCENKDHNLGIDPCGECITCKKIISKNHPDVVRVHRDKRDYRIEEIREQFIDDIGIRPYSGEKKIYIIEDAEKMTPLIQNAVLKTLEEPPLYATIILETTNVEGMLQTIKSRSVILNFKSLRDRQVIKYLIKNEQLPDYEAKICAAFAQGNIGKAVKLARSEVFKELKWQATNMLTEIKSCRNDRLGDYIKNAIEIKADITEYLDLITIWVRDVLIYKSTGKIDKIIFQQNIMDIKKFAEQYTFYGLENILKEIEFTKSRIRANVKFELAIELLLRTIKES